MPNQYPEYDLDGIKEQLRKTEWQRLLPVFAFVKLANLNQLVDWTGLDPQKVRRDLKVMLGIGEPSADATARTVLTCDLHSHAHRAWERRGARVYRLGKLGAALLREQGLLADLRPAKELRPTPIAQSLCILDVAREATRAELTYQVERELVAPSGRCLRPDLMWQDEQQQWHLVEIEQAATAPGRILRRLENWRAFFAAEGRGTEVASATLMLVFNETYAGIDHTVAVWEDLLGKVAAKYPLPFTVHYGQLMFFLEEPDWWGLNYPLLLAPPPPVVVSTPVVEAAPALPPMDLDHLRTDTDLNGLVQTCLWIYEASRGMVSTPESRYGIPVASLRRYRAWLEQPAQQPLRNTLVEVHRHWKPWGNVQQQLALVNRGARAILWHFGVERSDWLKQSRFEFAALPPTLYGGGPLRPDYHVDVKLDQLFQDLQKWGWAGEVFINHFESAFKFFLSAPFAYAELLGLATPKGLGRTTPASKKSAKKSAQPSTPPMAYPPPTEEDQW